VPFDGKLWFNSGAFFVQIFTMYSPLTVNDIEELVPVLHSEAVFEFIGGMPSRADFTLGLQRAIAGPPKKDGKEHWINYGVRLAETNELIGRIEATVHDDLAEVGFLYSPKVWGKGYATEGLLWLHHYLRGFKNVSNLWATTHPQNLRSAALLKKAGYVEAAARGLPVLYSYDAGDRVFHCSVA
jgi:RimJ/RimL family protein N-acetyltransferase